MKFKKDIKKLLDEKFIQYNTKGFIENDPVQIPHLFAKKEDIEIAGFLAATIAWGNRRSIINNATRLMNLMENSPYEFVTQHTQGDLKRFDTFVHRTFNGVDCTFFIRSLKNIYATHGSMESAFSKGLGKDDQSIKNAIIYFRQQFLRPSHQERTEKHISNPLRNSSAKRLCMYLRWMVRKDSKGVDLGIWKSIQPRHLCLPLDVHTGNVSRKLGLLKRKQDDWKAVEEITSVLREFDPVDPIKYDFSLFGLGVSKEI
jgi:uncharacterized protein (TIGR02757 family)